MQGMGLWLKKEWNALDRLSPEGKRLLIAYLLTAVADPMLGVFTSAFLWQKAQGLTLAVLYSVMFFSLLSVGFAFNALLLKRFESRRLFWLGCLLQGLVPFLVIFLDASEPFIVAFLGAMMGLAGGIYWSNRNFLTLRMTKTGDRLYFGSLEFSSATLVAIAVPVLVGWLLVYGERQGLYSVSSGYRVMATIGILIMFFAGAVAQKVRAERIALPTLRLPALTKKWKALRKLEIVHGFHHGVETVVPTAIVLAFVGQEDSIGALQSLSAVLAAIAIYIAGSRENARTRSRLLVFWVVSSLVAAAAFGIWFSFVGVIVYFVISSLSGDFRWVSLMAVTFDLIEDESALAKSHDYPFILDREIFLNLGRVSGLLAFWGLSLIAPSFTLRFILLGAGLLQVVVPSLARRAMGRKDI